MSQSHEQSIADKATILLIDDHPMLRNGVKQLIEMSDIIEVVAESNCGQDGIALAQKLDPDLILLDLNMPEMGGIETLCQLRECELSGRILVFTVSNFEEDVVSAFKLGADGYLLKDMEPEDLLLALEKAASGKVAISDDITTILTEGLKNNPSSAERDIYLLTAREREIVKLIAKGLSNKLIAKKLSISEGTVKVHVKNILKKLKLKTRLETAAWVHNSGVFNR
ncbi:two-component system response regulator NarL [Shewanella sp. C32]|jgi:two-component system nitrate/nitrite response regulator NarL|uniref:Two-component system response regulator NarL n=1 Tax=Shewanella electrica TaxID=515560 RepID=A0ABT2FIK4_9GAMM|nr:two-component system response regulator NarL [Shewanella electrica]MCH1924185.1 two-component system response regulator NarL [Shewanella electrica]MCS4556088.1 two-component system response regulator NarL [Shewanella electrica]